MAVTLRPHRAAPGLEHDSKPAAAPLRRPEAEPRLSALVSHATKDLSSLVRDELALAKAETRRDVKQAAAGGGLFGAAALLGLFTLIMLSLAAAWGLSNTGLGLAWSMLIVAGAYLLAAGLCAGVGFTRLKRIRGVQATKRNADQSLAVLKRAAR
jgi:Putative Actinobacterial Holin-X, holin superfamily III